MKLTFAALAVGLLLPHAASAADIWTCSYPAYTADKRPVLVRYELIGNKVVESTKIGAIDWKTEFTVVKNDRFALIATSSQTANDPGKPIAANATTIIIAKQSDEYLRANAFLHEPGFGGDPIKGSCLRN